MSVIDITSSSPAPSASETNPIGIRPPPLPRPDEDTLRMVYASRPHVLEPGQRAAWDQNMINYAASRVRAACTHYLYSWATAQYNMWWMRNIEMELREALCAVGAASSHGSPVFVPPLLRDLIQIISPGGPLQLSNTPYWQKVLDPTGRSRSRIVWEYENAWWDHPEEGGFHAWWGAEENRYNPTWLYNEDEAYHLYLWECQVSPPCASVSP